MQLDAIHQAFVLLSEGGGDQSIPQRATFHPSACHHSAPWASVVPATLHMS